MDDLERNDRKKEINRQIDERERKNERDRQIDR